MNAAPGAPPVRARRRQRWPRVLVYLLIALTVLSGAGIGGLAWYFSSQALQLSPDHPTYSLRVLALRSNTVELTRTDDTVRPGTYSLQWHGGGRVTLGAVVSSSQQGVVRRISGATQGLRVGTQVSFDFLVFGSPAALHLTYRSVNVPDRSGPCLPGTFQGEAPPGWYSSTVAA